MTLKLRIYKIIDNIVHNFGKSDEVIITEQDEPPETQTKKPKNPILYVLSAKNWTLLYVKIKFWSFDTPGTPGGPSI